MTLTQEKQQVKKIELTDKEKEDTTKLEKMVFDITNLLIDDKLCGFELTLQNGWKVSFKNKKFAKQIGVPM